MDGREPQGRRTGWAYLVALLAAGSLLVGLAAPLLAASPASTVPAYPSKGLYWGGRAYVFRAETYWVSPYHQMKLEEFDYANGSFVRDWTLDLTQEAVGGGLGTCVYDNLLYCFFTTTGGALQYITVDAPTRKQTGPTTIATGVHPGGAAAAVVEGTIYVMVAPGSGFKSGDGKSFTTWTPEFSKSPPSEMIDAVTIYPGGDGPASILFVYYDSAPSQALASCVVAPTAPAAVTQETILPWPPANPALWKPLLSGNLLLGTAGSPYAGAKAPCVQLYGLTDLGSDNQHQGRWEYNLTTSAWTFSDITQQDVVVYINAFPWFTTEDSTKGTMRSSHVLEIHGNRDQYLTIQSDWMVPQNDSAGYGWEGMPTPTNGSAGTNLQNLWTLVGVVLGPPPFPMNGEPNACGNVPLSQVSYGKDTSTTVSTSTTMSSTITVASESKIKGGLGSWTLDLSYAHAWTSSYSNSKTKSVSQEFQFSPCSEQGTQGIHGWAIFNAPTLVTQWYKLYAYDFNLAQNTGTYLDQDIYATSLGAVVQQTAFFALADPSQGDYPNLFAGMPVYPNSTDVAGWHSTVPNWDGGGADWTVIFGDTSNPQMPELSLGDNNEVAYTEEDETLTSKENSSSFSVSAGDKFDIFGFSESLTAGYDGEWSTSTENESTITQNVTCDLNVPIPGENPPPGTITSMNVQPFWLQANTTKAPWLPKAYGTNFPWCITWDVTQFQMASGATAGYAGPPTSASGIIRQGGDNPKDTYALSGGRLSWLRPGPNETPVPLGADQFDPAKGASVSLNGHTFAADGSKGKWSRKGDIWKYKTKEGVTHDPFTLVLDLAGMTWAFDASSKDLDQEIKATDGGVRVDLEVQGLYRFSHRLGHDVEASWSHDEPKSSWTPYGVHGVDGEYASRTGTGTLKMKGHLPKKVDDFGDLEIRINQERVRVPLLSQEGFLDDLDHGRTVKYKAEGLSFEIDFKAGQWKMTLNGPLFRSGMAPKRGELRVRVYLGGTPLSDQTFSVEKHKIQLTYSR